jgi:hypothetical protein
MATTKAQQKAVNKYIKNNYDRLNITLPAGRKQAVEAHAKSKGESVNGLVNALLMAEMGLSESEWKKGKEEG